MPTQKSLQHGRIRSFARKIRVSLANVTDPAFISWYHRHARRLAKFRDIHTGEDCFIIGNGPSLKRMDLRPLNQFHTFGLNKIFLLFARTPLELSYHVAVNPLVIEQSAREIESLVCASFISYKPGRLHIRPLNHIHYIYTEAPFTFCGDLTDRICEGYTVTFVAMEIAFFMGFRRVFLIGVDHHFAASGSPNEQQILTGADPNHFDPNYFANQSWHLPDLEGSELAYHLARFFFARAGRQIVDATVDGKLRIFPKQQYDEALAIAQPRTRRPVA